MSQDIPDRRPGWVRWNARDWSFFLLQMFLGMRLLLAGLGKFHGPQGMSFGHFYGQVLPALRQPFLEGTWLPGWMLTLYLGILPYLEILIGAAILVAGRNRVPLVMAGCLFLSLAGGQMLIGGHTTVADIGIHLALTVGALWLVEERLEK